MEKPIHSMGSLFDQLGLDSTEAGIAKFIEKNGRLSSEIELHDAPFWNASQAIFLRKVVAEDADWVEVVDHLDTMLR